MKNLINYIALMGGLFFSTVAYAQNPLTMLVHNGESTPYYGLNSFIDAYNASENGDFLYLSPGFYNPPEAIAKSIKVIGAGHFPDSEGVSRRTTIIGNLMIHNGANNLHLEGLFIQNNIGYQGDAKINFVKVLRCRFIGAEFLSNSGDVAKNNCSFEECFFHHINFYSFGNNLLVRNSVISDKIHNINSNALIEGNIFLLHDAGRWAGLFNNVNSSIIRKNIILSLNPSESSYLIREGTGNVFDRNIFIHENPSFGTNAANNNFLGIPQESIFVNQSGNEISYEHDYHLKNPELYIGMDGSQVGIYGGANPFKEGGLPSNPQILESEVANQTDEQGNLQIRFTVKAQDR